MSMVWTLVVLVLLICLTLAIHRLLEVLNEPEPRDVWAEHDAAWVPFPSPEFLNAPLSDWTEEAATLRAWVEAAALDDDEAVAAWLDGAR